MRKIEYRDAQLTIIGKQAYVEYGRNERPVYAEIRVNYDGGDSSLDSLGKYEYWDGPPCGGEGGERYLAFDYTNRPDVESIESVACRIATEVLGQAHIMCVGHVFNETVTVNIGYCGGSKEVIIPVDGTQKYISRVENEDETSISIVQECEETIVYVRGGVGKETTNSTVVIYFEPAYSYAYAGAGSGGTVEVSGADENGRLVMGDIFTMKAIPDECHEFEKWQSDGYDDIDGIDGSEDDEVSIIGPGFKSCDPVYATVEYTLSYVAVFRRKNVSVEVRIYPEGHAASVINGQETDLLVVPCGRPVSVKIEPGCCYVHDRFGDHGDFEIDDDSGIADIDALCKSVEIVAYLAKRDTIGDSLRFSQIDGSLLMKCNRLMFGAPSPLHPGTFYAPRRPKPEISEKASSFDIKDSGESHGRSQ